MLQSASLWSSGCQFSSVPVCCTPDSSCSACPALCVLTRCACRAGEAPSVGLTEHLQGLGFETGRLKTGTPARVDRTTVDFSVMEAQPGDEEVSWFSFDTRWHVPREQMPCYLTHTNAATHQLIRDNLHESPQYGGWVDSMGPRYCPSIEDKIVRFADKERHQIFIEPEGRTTPELYIQVRFINISCMSAQLAGRTLLPLCL